MLDERDTCSRGQTLRELSEVHRRGEESRAAAVLARLGRPVSQTDLAAYSFRLCEDYGADNEQRVDYRDGTRLSGVEGCLDGGYGRPDSLVLVDCALRYTQDGH